MRVKKLREKKSEDCLKEPFVCLKILVDKSMAVQKLRHEQLREQFEKRQKEFLEKSQTDPSAKKPRQPGKVFSWDSETKEALLKLLKTKKNMFAISRPRGTTVEDWIKQYMDEELKVPDFASRLHFFFAFYRALSLSQGTLKTIMRFDRETAV